MGGGAASDSWSWRPSTGGCSRPGSARSRRVERWGSHARPVTAGAPRPGACPGSAGRDGPDRAVPVAAGAPADRHLAPAGPGSARDRSASWACARPRSAGSCAATSAAHDRGHYDGDLAHARARQSARRPRRPDRRDEQLRRVIQSKLELEWSPEQIAAYLRRDVPRAAELARVSRDDLPGALPRREGRAEQDIDPAATDRAAAAETAPSAHSPRRSGSSRRPG